MNKTSVGKDSMVLWHVRDLSEQDGKDFDLEQYLSELYSDEYALKKIRDGWCDTAYVTDGIYKHTELFVDGFCTLFDYTSFTRQMLGIVPGARPEAPEDLFRGELEAVVFKVGSYLVRASSRIYVVSSEKYYPFKYTGKSVEAILDRLPTACVISKKDGASIIEAEVYGKGVLMWLLSQGASVEILRPQSMREEMRKTIEEMLKKYQE